MKAIDIYLQNKRIEKAKQFIRQNDCVLDIGSHDGVMFEQFGNLMSKGIGVDPSLEKKIEKANYTLIPGYFPDVCPEGIKYDAITMLAVLEHIPHEKQIQLAKDCAKFLNTGGRVIITVPSPPVDFILDVLTTLRIIDGMAIHEHYGFKPKDTLKIFSEPEFKLLHHEIFQLGLNNFFVFEKN
ncbi:MAG: class I SAM-dependent methyltransferase [Bacteroidia bacterium]